MTTQNIGLAIFLQAALVSVFWLPWVKNEKPSKNRRVAASVLCHPRFLAGFRSAEQWARLLMMRKMVLGVNWQTSDHVRGHGVAGAAGVCQATSRSTRHDGKQIRAE